MVDVTRRIKHEHGRGKWGYGESRAQGLDFGLLQLRKNLVFSDSVKAIQLPESLSLVEDNAIGVVTGWGVRVKNEVSFWFLLKKSSIIQTVV